ncbi:MULTISPECIES: hypothetical protein [Leclercia]|nr:MULTISPECIES: hypothetical protein [Leclercia]
MTEALWLIVPTILIPFLMMNHFLVAAIPSRVTPIHSSRVMTYLM